MDSQLDWNLVDNVDTNMHSFEQVSCDGHTVMTNCPDQRNGICENEDDGDGIMSRSYHCHTIHRAS